MDHRSPERGSTQHDAAPPARTFSRRIDCDDAGRRPAFAAATRGGGMREPAPREPFRARVRD